ncbi:MAG: hypothetical protein HKN21_15825 [Candidatus Eisenbacteria bacterium]|uniref:Uncharacterized protein n=1 Tax=Eiseniibacteriota bacterium TaxID=2212470 RepID=A0A7Y2EBV1_UNCEI|nr:hypothetical protein [Candidatus Eisenbacteria bacterium]
MNLSGDIWVWVAAILTLAIMSYLYKDNPIYKFAEYLFVGVASGYYLSIYYANVMVPNLFTPVGDGVKALGGGVWTWDLWRLVALVLGLMLFSRLIPKFGWPSRWPMGLLVGAYSGLAIMGFAQGDLLAQLQDSLIPIIDKSALSAFGDASGMTNKFLAFLNVLSHPILIIGLLSTLYYFFFSQEHTGVSGKVAKVGIWFLMISFGASYGFTVMARVTLALDRLRFLFGDWLGLNIL